MSTPEIAAKNPFAVAVEKGKDYYWCACGRSKSQPFCDGSHKGTDFAPVKFTATESNTVYFCGCKQSGNSPLCDGTHKRL
ncbi:MAG: CDGSH iron-sulfur domain-containing protein [Betaproteobacteria bacterium]|nr:CDGSH iron-sulfur domain-containing protein [Betaproteobacteria bacterium]